MYTFIVSSIKHTVYCTHVIYRYKYVNIYVKRERRVRFILVFTEEYILYTIKIIYMVTLSRPVFFPGKLFLMFQSSFLK